MGELGRQLVEIKKELDISVPMDNKNSGQALSQLVAEKNSPVADVVYYGVSFGINAAEQGVVESYQPANWDQIPEGLKDPEGKWFAIHSGTMGFFVNADALMGPMSHSLGMTCSSRNIAVWWDT